MLIRFLGIIILLMGSGCHANLSSPPVHPQSDLIRGQSNFSTIRPFLLHATIADIVDNATVSLIDSVTNISVETGITDSNGDFTLNPNSSILNNDGGIYWLEANKRPDLIGTQALFLRTVIKRQNGRFYSITNGASNPDDISLINSSTTALVIADQLDATIEPGDLIGKVNKTIPQALSANSTLNAIDNIKNQIETNLTNNNDPLNDNTYILIP